MTKKETLTIYHVDSNTNLMLPYADGGIRAGFPSPAQDYIELSIDLNKELIKHKEATFLGRVSGDSMIDAGLSDGDIVVIDKSLKPQNGDMAVCHVDGEFTIKFIEIHPDYIMLNPANKNFKPIKVTSENDFIIWGVVTYSISKRR